MIAVFLIGAAAVLLLHSFLYRRNWTRALSVRVLFSRPHVCAKETLELAEIIENRKKMALPLVEIGFRIPQGLHFEDAENILESDYVYKRDIFAVRGMERIVRRYRLTSQKRGFYSVSQLTCHTPSRLFLQTYMWDRMAQEEDAGLYVYASNTDCSVLLRAVEVILGEKESARRMYEDPFVFSSIRPYTIHDPMKTINWKATARTSELMVNTYASTAQVRVRIFLDVCADPGIPLSDTFREMGISMAASLIRSLVKRQMDASLLVNCAAGTSGQGRSDGAVHFPSCFGAGKLTSVEEFLTTDFDACSLLTFEEMIRRESLPGPDPSKEQEVFVFITCCENASLKAAIRKLLGGSRSGILALMSRTADGRREAYEGNLHILPVCDTN